MQHLYAPWRSSYISTIDKPKSGCVFCQILKSAEDKKNLVIKRLKSCYIVLNLYPYSNGHCLIVPNRHVADISELTMQEQQDFFAAIIDAKQRLTVAFAPTGFNVGINLGRHAGAGIPDHLHGHIVPRWLGDHNFMPITAETKIISRSLEDVYQQLCVCKPEKKSKVLKKKS